jgi:hypothetical protein
LRKRVLTLNKTARHSAVNAKKMHMAWGCGSPRRRYVIAVRWGAGGRYN